MSASRRQFLKRGAAVTAAGISLPRWLASPVPAAEQEPPGEIAARPNPPDTFDSFDANPHPWNPVTPGPRKDIVGPGPRAARGADLRLGVTVHAARAWSWFEVAQGADKEGPLAGVPYDGKLTRA